MRAPALLREKKNDGLAHGADGGQKFAGGAAARGNAE